MKLPKHIAIIPDGNRRWAIENVLKPQEGHRVGADVAEQLFDWCFIRYDIPIVSVYSLSTENLDRQQEELEYLWKIYGERFKRIADDKRVHTHYIRVNVLGDLSPFPNDLRNAIDYAMGKTKNYTEHLINFLMAYGGRDEIVQAAKKFARDVCENKLKPDDLSEDIFARYLFTNNIPDPDLVIRTGNEERMSNFLPWQTVYSEIVFVKKYWPDFTFEDLERILTGFSERRRHFGR